MKFLMIEGRHWPHEGCLSRSTCISFYVTFTVFCSSVFATGVVVAVVLWFGLCVLQLVHVMDGLIISGGTGVLDGAEGFSMVEAICFP